MTDPDKPEVLGRVVGSSTLLLFECPGCQCAHHLETKPGGWSWNGNMVSPTASPSLLVRSPRWRDGVEHQDRCHFYMRDGMLQFLQDCTHALAGQTVEMGPWKDETSDD